MEDVVPRGSSQDWSSHLASDLAGDLAVDITHDLMRDLAADLVCEVTGEVADGYLERASTLLRAAHLNVYFPPVLKVLAHLGALHSRVHGGLYPRLAIEVNAGLPAPREWRRLDTDVQLAEAILPRLPT